MDRGGYYIWFFIMKHDKDHVDNILMQEYGDGNIGQRINKEKYMGMNYDLSKISLVFSVILESVYNMFS